MIELRMLEPDGGNLYRLDRKKQVLFVAGVLWLRRAMTLLTRAIDVVRGTLQLFVDELRSTIGKQIGKLVSGDWASRISRLLVALLSDDLGENQVPDRALELFRGGAVRNLSVGLVLKPRTIRQRMARLTVPLEHNRPKVVAA